MKYASQKILFFIGIFMLTFGGTYVLVPLSLSPFAAQADSHESPAAVHAAVGADTIKCREEMAKYINAVQPEYAKYINELFRGAEATSALVQSGVERYRLYQRDLISRYRQFLPEDAAKLTDELNDLPSCRIVVDEELLVAREVLKSHVINNAQAKQTTRMVEFYKQMNKKMEELHFAVADLYGYFQLFANKLPCYAQECVQSGG